MSVKSTSPRQSPAEQPAIELESFLPYRLNALAETVSRSLSRHYADQYGISVPEWRVLATLGQYRRMTAKAIGAHSRMNKTKVSRAVAALCARRLVAREPNVADLREAFLTLTGEGRDIYDALVPEALAFERDVQAVLSPEERRLFGELVTRLQARAEDLAGGRGRGD